MTSQQQEAEAYGGELTVEHNLCKPLANAATQHPDNAAVICMHQPSSHLSDLTSTSTDPNEPKGQDQLTWSHRNLSAAAQNVALALQQQGVERGETMATLIPNRVEWAVLMYASVLLGLTFAPLDFGAVSEARAEELAGLMALLVPSVVVVPDGEGAEAVNKALQSSGVKPTLRIVLDAIQPPMPNWTHLPSLITNTSINSTSPSKLLEEANTNNPTHTALIYFTSGTTSGQPKGCPRTVSDVSGVNAAQADKLQFSPSTRFLMATANFRVISGLALAVWSEGAAVVVPDVRFSPQTTLDAIEQHGITHMLLVPALLHVLVADPSFADRDVTSITHCFLGGDIITKDVYLKAVRAFPQANVMVAHGMSEGGGIFGWPFIDVKAEEIPFMGEIAPIGVVAQGSSIRIVDDETGQVIMRGQTGELHLSSPNLIKHYLGGIHEDTFHNDADGTRWFQTGDLAVMNEEGLLYVLGRVKDRIKRAGVPITPAALESCIDKYTGSQTSVVGIPHPTLGHEPFAVVKSRGGKSNDEVKQDIVDVFGKDFSLGGVLELGDLELEAFPLNSTGKVMKIMLQENVVQYLQKQ